MPCRWGFLTPPAAGLAYNVPMIRLGNKKAGAFPMMPRAVLLAGVLCLSAAAQPVSDPAQLWGQASLYRDEWGIPHVYADNPYALGFAFGYAQAEDHLESMLLAYRMATGRLAAVLGEAYAASDVFALKMGHGQIAGAGLAQADPVTRDLCEGFALGVNAFLVDRPDQAPAWADGVRPEDILALWHAFLMSFAPLDLPGAYRPPPAMDTSSAWAMAPSRMAEDRAVLVINPHQHYQGPFQWYEAHLSAGDLNMYGAALRGIPVIVQGHNGALGWGLTPNFPDFADVYDEQPAGGGGEARGNPKDPRRSAPELPFAPEALAALEYMSRTRPYHVLTERGLEERHTPVYLGARGPILEGPQGGLFSWRIGGYGMTGGLRQLIEMGRAQNLAQFQAALSAGQIPCFHVVYADREGNIFYLYNTRPGLRPDMPPVLNNTPGQEPLSYDRPLPLTLDVLGWAELVAVDALPAITNPASGYVQACGNPPWTVTENPPFGPANWPGWLARDGDSHRAMRARQLLRAGTRSFRDHQSMLFDTVVPAAMDTVPVLLAIADNRPDLVAASHPDMAAGLDLLRKWNFVADTNAAGMTFYHVWWAMFRAQLAMGAPVSLPDRELFAALASGAPQAQEAAIRAAADAARTLRNTQRTLSVPWGDVHRLRRGARDEAAPGAGTGEPLLLLSDQMYDGEAWRATYGTGFAMAVQFGDPAEAFSLSPFGASENPQSPHFSDQMDLLLERRLKPARHTAESVLRHARLALGCRVTLLPRGVSGALTLVSPAPLQARVATLEETPVPLPEGHTAFTLFMEPERSPKGAPVTVDLSVQLPPELCVDSGLDQLSLFALEEGLGWYSLTEQELDRATRTFHGHHDTAARLYALLGPAELLPPAGLETPAAPPEERNETGTGLFGLDVLLANHPIPRPSSGRGGLFVFERGKSEKKDENDSVTTENDENGDQKRLFKMQIGEHESSENTLPIPEVPGFHFGPGAHKPQEQYADGTAQKIFKLERLDRVQLPGETEVPGTPMSGEAAPLPTQGVETPPQKEEEKTPEDAQEPPPVPEGPTKNFNRSEAEIPANIPRDPAFNFGPAFKENAPASADTPGTGTRVFKIERESPGP